MSQVIANSEWNEYMRLLTLRAELEALITAELTHGGTGLDPRDVEDLIATSKKPGPERKRDFVKGEEVERDG